jgi:hypothetical protein
VFSNQQITSTGGHLHSNTTRCAPPHQLWWNNQLAQASYPHPPHTLQQQPQQSYTPMHVCVAACCLSTGWKGHGVQGSWQSVHGAFTASCSPCWMSSRRCGLLLPPVLPGSATHDVDAPQSTAGSTWGLAHIKSQWGAARDANALPVDHQPQDQSDLSHPSILHY